MTSDDGLEFTRERVIIRIVYNLRVSTHLEFTRERVNSRGSTTARDSGVFVHVYGRLEYGDASTKVQKVKRDTRPPIYFVNHSNHVLNTH